MNYTLCLDIGATKIAGALIDKKARISNYQQIPTQAKESNNLILNNTYSIIQKLIGVRNTHVRSQHISSINLSFAGQIDIKRGLIIKSPNFNKNFKNIKIKKLLQKKFKLPVYIENDANCFALGEAYYGLGKGYKNIVGITLGSGVGGGIIINGQLYRGKNNLAGEFGQMIMSDKPWEKNKKNIQDLNYVTNCLYNILHIIDPDIIIIGGGISNMPKLVQKACQNTRKLIYYSSLCTTPILRSKLQVKANLLGAYLLNKN